jgi:hypothetical protein
LAVKMHTDWVEPGFTSEPTASYHCHFSLFSQHHLVARTFLSPLFKFTYTSSHFSLPLFTNYIVIPYWLASHLSAYSIMTLPVRAIRANPPHKSY